MIEFRSVKKVYNKKSYAVRNASFKIDQGEFVFLVGPSGAGKSTLLKMLYKEEKPSDGTVMVYHKDVKKIKTKVLRRNVGVVFQDFESTLLKNKSAYENVAYVLESLGENPFKIRKKALHALAKMGIVNKAKNKPNELSGGEKQRVAIARAIVNSPDILICDEPTGNLDEDTAEEIMTYIKELNQQGTTIIMSTHNKEIIRREKKRVIIVEGGRVKEFEFPQEKRKDINLEAIMKKEENEDISYGRG